MTITLKETHRYQFIQDMHTKCTYIIDKVTYKSTFRNVGHDATLEKRAVLSKTDQELDTYAAKQSFF